MGDIVPRSTIVKHGTSALGGIVGGIVLLVLPSLVPLGSLIVGGVIVFVGIGISMSKEDRVPGLIALGAGILTALGAIPIIGSIAGFLLKVSGAALLVMGAIKIFQFFKGLRSRS